MKKIKLLSVITAILMVLPMVFSCNRATPEQSDTSQTDPEQTQTTPSDTDGTSDTSNGPDTIYTDVTDTDPGAGDTARQEDTTLPDDTTDAQTQPVDETTKPSETTAQPDTTAAPVTDAVTTGRSDPDPKDTYVPATDLLFKQVYGTGKNNDTPVRYSFIELKNVSDKAISLKGLRIFSYDTDAKKFVYNDFPDVSVPASASYLIRCAEAKGKSGEAYETAGERLNIAYYDLSWNVVLNNKEIQLAITDSSKTLSSASRVSDVGAYSYFIATESVTADKNTARGISKNKAAYRASKTAAYEIVDYKNAPASDVIDHAPLCLKGDLNGEASVASNVVVFSAEAGVYSQPLTLTLKALDGYKIYYTTDGTDPRTSGKEYTGPISIGSTSSMAWGKLTRLCNSLSGIRNPSNSRQQGARVIKAYATNGKTKTQVATNTYIVSDILKYDTAILSMSIEPDEFISADRGIYHTQMSDPFGTKMRRTAYFEIIEATGKRVSASYIEIALNGNGSLGFGAKSIRTYFKSDAEPGYIGNPSKLKYDIFRGEARDGVTEYKRLLLRNSGNDSSQSHLRDAYMQKLCSTLNAPTMAYRPALLFINGEMWGVYNIRERYDKKYFESHYGIPEEDFCMLESISPLITGSWNTPYAVNDGEEGDEKPFHELVSYIERTDLSSDANFKYVSDRIDIDNMIDYFVGCMFLCNTDWPGNNIKVWRNKNASNKNIDTKWRFAFSDMDMGVGLATNIDTNMFAHAINDNTVAGRIFNRMLRNETFKNKFIDRFYECTNTIFSPDKTVPVLDGMYNRIKDVMPLHFTRWPGDGGSTANFNNQINSIKYFMNNRGARAIAQMEEFFKIQPKQFSVTFDEAALSVKVDGKSVSSGYSVTLKSATKASLVIEAKSGYKLSSIKTYAADGRTKSYTVSSITLNIDSTLNVVILSEKTGGNNADAQIVTGSRAMFALGADGVLYAWGNNEYGQLGITSGTITTPLAVASNVVKVATSMGGTEGDAPMTAILTSSGDVYTTGNNSSGQLARSGDTRSFIKVPLSFKAKDISCGYDHMIIIAENGDMYGIGNNTYGQLGQSGFGGNISKLQKIDSGVKLAAAGRRHTIYIKEDDGLYVLGDNRWSKFKEGAGDTLTQPLKLGDGFAFVSTGQHNCVAVDNKGDMYYIGWRSTATFNAGEAAGRPVKIAEGMKCGYIMDEHIIMLSTDGMVYGYGLNSFRQISSDAQLKNTPTFIMDGCVGCGAGTHYSAALRSDGSVVLWGNNVAGVMGNGRAEDAYVSSYTAIKLK